MSCYKPLNAFLHVSGRTCKNVISFRPPGKEIQLPCGQCIGCRIDKSKQWAIRCVHEAQMHPDNSFITLTYSDEHLPTDGGLCPRHFQLFMKRLRKYFQPLTIRFYQCGEYGEKLGRPHYHALLFNLEFPDREIHKIQDGTPLYTSPLLEKIWGKGFCSIGEVNFKTAGYVSRYIMKKITGEPAHEHYTKIDPLTGEVFQVKAEYTTMSLKPGIGKPWFDQYQTDVFPGDFVVLDGKKLKTPNYYTELLKKLEPSEYQKIKEKRIRKMEEKSAENTPERLAVREYCQQRKLEKLIRPLI